MTAASTGPTAAGTPGAGPRPQLLTIAAILLGVAAILGLLLPLTTFTDSRYIGCSRAVTSANATPTASGSPSSTTAGSASPSASSSSTASARTTVAAQLNREVRDCYTGATGALQPGDTTVSSKDVLGSLVGGAIPLVLFGGLAFFVFRGVPLTRWFVVGLWVISNVIPVVAFSLLQGVSAVGSDAVPVLAKVVLVLGTLVFTGSVVIVNLKPVTRYYNSRRPVRAAGFGARPPAGGAGGGGGGLLASFFRPRPPARGTTGPTVSTTKPPAGGTSSAATRPAGSPAKGKGGGGSGNTGRAKGKRRG